MNTKDPQGKKLTEAYARLDEWATEVERHFKGQLKVLEGKKQTLNELIATATFSLEVDERLRAGDVTAFVHKIGMKYSRDARYFFLFDKREKFLFLLLYPYDGDRRMSYLDDNG